MGASFIASAPNRGARAPSPRSGDLLVPVGPPAATIAAEIVDTPRPRGTVFVLHGIRADREAVRGWADILARDGFRAVLVDLRGHGRSTGSFLSYGVVESRDLTQVLTALEARGLVAGAVGVMGISYGAGTAIEWAAEDARVMAVVAVAPFASLRMVAPGYTLVPLPRGFIDGAIDRAGREAAFDPDEASPALAMARMHTPVLLIHGEDDVRVPAWHSQLLFAAGRSHSELILVPGAGHASIAVSHVIADYAPGWFAAHLPSPASSGPVEDGDAPR